MAAGERLTRAVERATAGRLPLIALPASGGTRMQEGTLAFLQMVKITGAVTAHRAAHLPYLVYLRHPSTGGVFASWASLGHQGPVSASGIGPVGFSSQTFAGSPAETVLPLHHRGTNGDGEQRP